MQRSIGRRQLQPGGTLTNLSAPLEPARCQLCSNRPASAMHPSQEPAVFYVSAPPLRACPPPQPNSSVINLGASIAMEPTKQGVPADPSSSQQQLQPYSPQSALPPDRRAVQRPQPQQQYPPPFALPPQQPAVQRLQLPNLPRWWGPYLSMLQQQQRRGYIPHVGAAIPGSINASHHGADTPRFNGPTVPHSPVAPKRSELSVNAEEYRPIFLPHRSVEQSSTTPSFSASQGQTSARGPQAGATDPFSGRRHRPLLSADQVDLRSWSRAPAIPRGLTGDMGFPGSPACVVWLLKEGHEDVRKSVFNGVLGALHFVMGSRNWCVVFLELLLARRFDELQVIVHVACTGGEVSLLDVANGECGYVCECILPAPAP
ncbi:uncharacterized protein [Setaria viridis]|uniref:uncharacterized protein n=1 Tax=Setaria viridis TaxID=4556 RepID=UPI003B3AED41